ncbi:hypothetical protein G4B88_029574 [Cannabis sativa]|uniref:Prokaryotic-type class I peptide chain release factors domain-containing protein n=1 Tax=Cannabis sativa TaxID=3483 RepID=A0A7J6DQ07_CANSA|nr:hypothetical protein G4B88_029574 [Cannabis sativa]
MKIADKAKRKEYLMLIMSMAMALPRMSPTQDYRTILLGSVQNPKPHHSTHALPSNYVPPLRERALSAMDCLLRPLCSSTSIIIPKPINNSLPLMPKPVPLLSLNPTSFPFLSPKHLPLYSRSPRYVLYATQQSQVSEGVNNETREWAMQDFYSLRKDVEAASERVEEIRASAGLQLLEKEVAALELKASDSSFWDDRASAQETLSALNDVKDKIKLLTEFKTKVEDAETIVTLTEEMDSTDTALLEEANSIIKELNKALDRFELTELLSGPYDKEGAVISITAGAGGTDAQDWADMLLRMYVRWGEKQRYKTRVVEKSQERKQGLNRQHSKLKADMLMDTYPERKELIGLFDSHLLMPKTSFSGVEVMPLLPEDSLDVEIPEEDLDISFSRAGGKGGQNVNKVETAVRITHIPTGVTVRCTEERSQLSNKIKALSRLKAKLLVIAEEQRATEIKQIRGDAVKAEWGQQIRNYVFHPYKLVKDVRTSLETSDVSSVMDGELEPFIKAYLKLKYTTAMSSND